MAEALSVLTALDTTVIVAGLLSWHEDHGRAAAALEGLFSRQEPGPSVVVPLPALVESYSVMTRMPRPRRLLAREAYHLLREVFETKALVTAQEPTAGWEFLQQSAEQEVSGGAIYDRVILAAALSAGARRLLTLNLRHFQRLAPPGIEILSP